MYFKFDSGTHDDELVFLEDLIELLDSRLDAIEQKIDSVFDPDQMGHFDETEYVIGMGFIACQRYLCSVYGPNGISKKIALEMGPHHTGGETIARVINAAANFWKHSEEWDFSSKVTRDRAGLNSIQLETIKVIETITPWGDYTCANLLAALVTPRESRLKHLLPQLEAWRDALDNAHAS